MAIRRRAKKVGRTKAVKTLAKSNVVVGNTVFGPRKKIGTVRKKRPNRRR